MVSGLNSSQLSFNNKNHRLHKRHGSSNRYQNTYTWTLEFAETPANLLPVEDDDDDDEDLDGGGDGAGDHHFRLPLLELADLCALDLNLGVRHCCKVRTQQSDKQR